MGPFRHVLSSNRFRPLTWKLLGLIAVGLSVLAAAGFRWCQPRPTTPVDSPWFSDLTEECRLNFRHDVGPVGKYFMPEIVGSGAALFDFDNDGPLDTYLIQNGGPGSKSTNALFHQG